MRRSSSELRVRKRQSRFFQRYKNVGVYRSPTATVASTGRASELQATKHVTTVVSTSRASQLQATKQLLYLPVELVSCKLPVYQTRNHCCSIYQSSELQDS